MKAQVLALVVVATLPVACGSYSPTSVEMETQAITSQEGSVLAQGGGKHGPAPTALCDVKAIELTVKKNSNVVATYRDGLGQVLSGCTAPAWSMSPTGQMVPDASGFTAKPVAPKGTYIVVASAYGTWTSIGITLK